MRLRIAFAVALVVVAGACVACTASDSDTPSATSSSATTETAPPAAEPSVTVEVTWFWAIDDDGSPLFRFVAEIGNPGAEALEGVETEWVVYDANNAIVGSRTSVQPVIPAGETVQYVGGAGGLNLTGLPASVEVRIVDPGDFVESTPPTLTVSDVEIELADGFNYHYVRALVTNGSEEVASAALDGDVILKNAAGEIVGADFWSAENLPETIAAETAFRVEFSVRAADEEPTTADVYIVVGPSSD